MTDVPKARPASTVVLLRDTDNGMETLMLKRNKALMFANMSALLRLSMSVSIPLSVSRNRTTVLAGLALGTSVTGILL